MNKLLSDRKEELKSVISKSEYQKGQLSDLKTLIENEPVEVCDIFLKNELKLSDKASTNLENFFTQFSQCVGGCLNFDLLVQDGYFVPSMTEEGDFVGF